jgi:hypothetical protein
MIGTYANSDGCTILRHGQYTMYPNARQCLCFFFFSSRCCLNKQQYGWWEENKNAVQVAWNCTRVRSVSRIIRSVGWCYRATVVRMRLRGEGMAGTDPRRRPLSHAAVPRIGGAEAAAGDTASHVRAHAMRDHIRHCFAVPLAFAGPVRPAGGARELCSCMPSLLRVSARDSSVLRRRPRHHVGGRRGRTRRSGET